MRLAQALFQAGHLCDACVSACGRACLGGPALAACAYGSLAFVLALSFALFPVVGSLRAAAAWLSPFGVVLAMTLLHLNVC